MASLTPPMLNYRPRSPKPKPISWRQQVTERNRLEAKATASRAVTGMEPFFAVAPTYHIREDERSAFPMMSRSFDPENATDVTTAYSWQRKVKDGQVQFAANNQVYMVNIQSSFQPRHGLMSLHDAEKWDDISTKDPHSPCMRMCIIGAEALADGPCVIGVDERTFERIFEQPIPTYILNFFTHVGQPLRCSVKKRTGYPEFFHCSLQLTLNHRGLARSQTIHITHDLRSRNSFLLCARPSRADRDTFCNLQPVISTLSPPCERCGSPFPSLLAFLSECCTHLEAHHQTHSLKSTSQNYRDMYDYSLDDVSITSLLGRKHHDTVKAFVDNLDLSSRTEFNWGLFCHTINGLKKALRKYKNVRELDGTCPCDEHVEEALEELCEHAEGMKKHASVVKNRKNDLLNLTYPLVSLFDSHLNFQVASSSQQIAHETKRDSTAMKVISAVTVVFLPPTFACSIFGMQFFSYESNAGIQAFTVSRLWWVYLAVAIPLTFLTTTIWLFWVWWKDREESKDGKDGR